jgi:hypothetical protein
MTSRWLCVITVMSACSVLGCSERRNVDPPHVFSRAESPMLAEPSITNKGLPLWGGSLGMLMGASKAQVGHPNSRKAISTQTRTNLNNRIHARWAAMGSSQKHQLGHALWGLYPALKDTAPAPHQATVVVQDPPAKQPCVPCGSPKGYPSDPCASIRSDLKQLMKDAILKGIIRDAIQALKQGLVDLQFWGGVADLIGNIVTTTTSLATAGTGGAFGKAAVGALKGIAMSEIKAAIVDQAAGMLPPPLDSAVSGELTTAVLDQILAAANRAVIDANKAKNAKLAQLQKCQSNYAATLKQIDSSNQSVTSCRQKNPGYCL